ncbi:MAG: hypothetical protein HKN39_04985 [Flavobacteriales bacterium]|nr:hypothetical protein [Flavobacteriales bacterium]
MGINEKIIFRQAVESDLEQLIDLTISSVTSSNGRSFFATIFDLSEEEYKNIVRDLFSLNISNNEYDIGSYFVLEQNDELISCLAGWKEGEGDVDSEKILPLMVMQHVGLKTWIEKTQENEEISKVNIPRERGKIQIENMFLKSSARGTSAFITIYFNTVDALFQKYPECNIVQSKFYATNKLAIRIAKHIGYDIIEERSFDTSSLDPYFQNEGIVMTELNREVFYSNKHFLT